MAISSNTLMNIQKNLFALKDFLDKNPHLFHSSSSEPSTARAPMTEQEAWKVRLMGFDISILLICAQVEQNSVSELLSLLSRTIEALSFVLLLDDYRLWELISQ